MRTLRTTLGATLLAGTMLVASPAHADAPPAPAGPAAPATTGAPAAPATTAPAEAAPAATPAPAGPATGGGAKSDPVGISEEARRHFAAGVALLQDPEGEKVEEAYREFRTAYDMSATPKILGNMGFCAMRLERDGEAIEAYTRYLREVRDIDAEERAQIVRDLQTLTIGVARLTIEVDKPGVRITDVRIPVKGGRVTNTYGPVTRKLEIGVRPGHHVITAKLPGHEDEQWEIDVFAASRDAKSFAMRPEVVAGPVQGPVPGARGPGAGPWILMGLGGAMVIGGAVTGIVALGKTNDIADKCPGDVCPRSFDLDAERSSARTFVRITDLLLIGGGVVAAGGLTWLFLSGSSEKQPATAAARPRVAIPLPSAGCGPDGCRASMKVVF